MCDNVLHTHLSERHNQATVLYVMYIYYVVLFNLNSPPATFVIYNNLPLHQFTGPYRNRKRSLGLAQAF